MLNLGPLRIDPPLVLAPMAGITDHVYRLMLRRIGGVGLVTMEFISSEAISRGNARQLRKMVFSDEERPLSIQIYGSDPERMASRRRHRRGALAGRLRHQHGLPCQQGPQGLRGGGAHG